ncbi:MAG TPA: class I SAM-dependent methyltransferase [Gemmataceae bacterium]|jgi:SAM-dependent methyltransferase
MNQATLRETEIRPDNLMKGQTERFASDIRRLLQNKHHFVSVPCPACDSADHRPAFTKYELNYVVCTQCATMYISPRPSPAVLENYYAQSENYRYWNQYIFPASEGMRRERIFRPRALRLRDICARHGIEGGVLLEVGAGFGTFCEEVQRLGLFQRVIAVEPTPDLAATCRHKGLEVIQSPIERVSTEVGQVDVVAAFEVLEHLFSPRQFVTACRERLAPGGLLLITCPNLKGFDVSVLGSLSNTVDVEHLNYFHPDSLCHLLEQCGFVPLEVQTPGELDAELVRKQALSRTIDLSSQPFLHRILLEDWERVGNRFQRFLADNLLSSHMWIVARNY